MAIGVSFLPGQQGGQAGAGPSDPADAVSQAIKILSLRLPRVVGANAISSPALLNAPGAAAVSGSGMNIDRLVQMILGGILPSGGAAGAGGGVSPSLAQIFGQSGSAGAPGGMSLPSPSQVTTRVIPGTDTPPASTPTPTLPMPTSPVTRALGPPAIPEEPRIPARPSQPQQGGGAGLDALFGPRGRRG